MLAIVLALVSAIGYGVSDFAAGLASRTASVIQVTLLACAAATVVVLAVLPLGASHRPSGAALAWGAAAGASGTLGGIALYLGFRYAAFSVAAPLSAVGTAGFSVLAGLLWGERPGTLALAGIALALPAIVGVSASAGQGEPAEETEGKEQARPAAGVAAGLIAGACFALLLIGLDRAGSGSGLWPAAAAEVAELAVAAAVAAVTRNLRLPRGRPGRLAVVAGVAGAAGTLLYFYASHHGLLAVVAVLTALYPASTIVLARVVLGERLTVVRLAGLALAGLCVALIAAAGPG